MTADSQRTNDDLLTEVTACTAKGARLNCFAEILSRTMTGKMTHEDFVGAQRAGYDQGFTRMLDEFRAGTYFGSWCLDFLSCIMMKESEIEADRARWGHLQAAAAALGWDTNATYIEAKEFAESRLWLSFKQRRQFLNDQGTGLRYDMSPALRASYDDARLAYIAATVKWGWAQPFD